MRELSLLFQGARENFIWHMDDGAYSSEAKSKK